jgi:hypothetical protein
MLTLRHSKALECVCFDATAGGACDDDDDDDDDGGRNAMPVEFHFIIIRLRAYAAAAAAAAPYLPDTVRNAANARCRTTREGNMACRYRIG